MRTGNAAKISLAALIALTPTVSAQSTEAGASGAPEQPEVGSGVRYEVTDGGYALTFPPDWDVITNVGETVVDRPGSTQLRISLLADGPDLPDTDFREGCHVSHRLPEGLSLDAIVAQHAAEAAQDRERLDQAPEVTSLVLPVGPAVRLEYAVRYPTFTRAYTAFYLSDGTLVHTLFCSGPQRPADGWMSIARSMEFLSVD